MDLDQPAPPLVDEDAPDLGDGQRLHDRLVRQHEIPVPAILGDGIRLLWIFEFPLQVGPAPLDLEAVEVEPVDILLFASGNQNVARDRVQEIIWSALERGAAEPLEGAKYYLSELQKIAEKLDMGGTMAKQQILPIVGDIKNLLTELSLQKDRLETECPTDWSDEKTKMEDLVGQIGSHVDRAWADIPQGEIGG